ncbi:MAG: NADH-quinone oxidoreductase subunit C, partial [Actinomycetota bacterium]|nr:NADH-quinone oxidoreductase subunit C [Actinomycetota bacterium]
MTESGIPVVPEGVSELDIVGVRRGSFQVSGSGDTSGFGGLVSPIVMPAPTERPYGGWFDELADEIELALADRNLPVSSVIDKVVVDRDEITFFVLTEYIVDFARMLRDEPGLRFEMCLG